jgi:hypothetical protein
MIICDTPHLLAVSQMGFIHTAMTSTHNEWDTLSKTTSRHDNDMQLRGYT